MDLAERVVLYISYASYIAFALVALGIDPPLAKAWGAFLKELYPAAIGIVLVLSANPLVDVDAPYLRRLAFTAGLFLAGSSPLIRRLTVAPASTVTSLGRQLAPA